jgi:hypothetical protein
MLLKQIAFSVQQANPQIQEEDVLIVVLDVNRFVNQEILMEYGQQYKLVLIAKLVLIHHLQDQVVVQFVLLVV